MKLVAMAACSAALTLSLAALSRAPYTPAHAGEAVLRFSWRMSVTARENCRQRTQQELDALPVHMRTPQECTRDLAQYALVIRVGDGRQDTLQLVRGGVRGDRPIFVLEQRTLPAGQHRIRLHLQRSSAAATDILAALDTVITLHAGRMQLVTLDADDRRLTVRSSARRAHEEEDEDDEHSAAARQPHRRDHDDDAEDGARAREQ